MKPRTSKPSGHLQVRSGKSGKLTYYAWWRDADGPHQRSLGPAWVSDGGKKTDRGATRWQQRSGRVPDGYLRPADAKELLDGILRAAPTASEPRPSARMTVGDAATIWLKRAEKTAKPSTYDTYRTTVGRLYRTFGENTALADLRAPVIAAKLEDIKAERRISANRAAKMRAAGERVVRRGEGSAAQHLRLTPPSLRVQKRYDTALRKLFQIGLYEGAINENPMIRIEPPGSKPQPTVLPQDRVLSPAEVRQVAAAAGDQDGDMILVAAMTGLRLGELIALEWDQVEWDRTTIYASRNRVRGQTVTPKSGKGRGVPMAPEVAAILQDREATRPRRAGSPDLVFRGKRGGYVDSHRLRSRYYQALAAAGVRRVRWHDLRHTFGTVLVDDDVPLNKIQLWMGHSHQSTTEIYAKARASESDVGLVSGAFSKV